MKMRMKSKGLTYKKFDLHIHTPASDDYKDKNIKPEDIVSTSIKKGLAGIAITDHHTGDWIDRVREISKKENLVVFPGVEVKVHGGEKGVHLIILFDTDKDSSHIKAFLNTLKVYSQSGNKDLITNKTALEVAKELQEFDRSAILVLAHCKSSKGVLGDMKGKQRSELFKPDYPCLLGAESTEGDFKDAEKIRKHTRVIDLFDGEYDEFHYKKLGVYQVSDAHSIAEIGQSYTYFKVDVPITIEDIRQSLSDRETRIRQTYEYEEKVYPSINSLKVNSGFLEGQEFEFNEGLNSILGGKGSGKSLAIEFLRFGLHQQPKIEEIYTDHTSKLDKCLRKYGQVEIIVTDDSGKKYLIRRTYNPENDNPTDIIDFTDGTAKNFEINQLFPVLFLSQSEVIKIAEDKSGATQRNFIDNFFDFHKYLNKINRLNNTLSEIDLKFADALKSHLLELQLKSKETTIKEEIEKLGRQLKSEIFQKFSKEEVIGATIKSNLDYFDTVKEYVTDLQNQCKNLIPPKAGDKDIDNNPTVKRVYETSEETIETVINSLGVTLKTIVEKSDVVIKEYSEWEKGFAIVKDEYEEIVRKTGGTQLALDQKRSSLVKELEALKRDLILYEGKAQQISALAGKRKAVIDALVETYKGYYEERKSKCDFLTNSSNNSIRVTILEQEDKTAFKNNLMRLKRGSWIKEEEIEILAKFVYPKDFIDSLLRYEWGQRKMVKPLKGMASKTGLSIDKVEKLACHFLDEYEYKEILSLLYTSTPEDVPTIEYRVGKDYKRLEELSVGQKATVFLVMALSDGIFPIIIDQPEDSLDLRTIWEDVCMKLRGTKEKRQFIFTTHNSSVAVASDTDKFTILQADAQKGTVLHTGSINNEDVKKEVLIYLEGGKDTYKRKGLKYNIN